MLLLSISLDSFRIVCSCAFCWRSPGSGIRLDHRQAPGVYSLRRVGPGCHVGYYANTVKTRSDVHFATDGIICFSGCIGS
jgi:hypothetical protein